MYTLFSLIISTKEVDWPLIFMAVKIGLVLQLCFQKAQIHLLLRAEFKTKSMNWTWYGILYDYS